jgi:hypothetical protein
MKRKILFLVILGSIFTVLNSCYFSTKRAVEKRHLEMKAKEGSLKFEVVWSETYEEENEKITIRKGGKGCTVVWVEMINNQDSITKTYSLHDFFTHQIISTNLPPGLRHHKLYFAVTDTINGNYFFDKEIMTSLSHRFTLNYKNS